MDKIYFTWTISPPDPIDGVRVTVGDVQKLDAVQANRYAAAGYGRIGKPEAKPDWLLDFTWREDQQGQVYGVMGIKAGHTTKVPGREAHRLQLQGHGTIGTELRPHVHDQAAIDTFYREEAERHHNPAFDPIPGSEPIGRRYANNFGRGGWGV